MSLREEILNLRDDIVSVKIEKENHHGNKARLIKVVTEAVDGKLYRQEWLFNDSLKLSDAAVLRLISSYLNNWEQNIV